MTRRESLCPICKTKLIEHSEFQDKICKMITIKEFSNNSPGFDVQFRPFFEDRENSRMSTAIPQLAEGLRDGLFRADAPTHRFLQLLGCILRSCVRCLDLSEDPPAAKSSLHT